MYRLQDAIQQNTTSLYNVLEQVRVQVLVECDFHNGMNENCTADTNPNI